MSNTEISRRSLLQAAAWSIPVLSLAVSAPAYAASTTEKAKVVMDTFAQNGINQSWIDGANRFTGLNLSANFRLEWDSPVSLTSATLTITLPSKGLSSNSKPTVSGDGWSYGGSSTGETTTTFAFTFAGTVSANSTSPMITIQLKGDGKTAVSDLTPFTVTGLLTGNFTPISKSVTLS